MPLALSVFVCVMLLIVQRAIRASHRSFPLNRIRGELNLPRNIRPRSVREAGAGPAVPGFVRCLPTPRSWDLEGQLTRQQAEARYKPRLL